MSPQIIAETDEYLAINKPAGLSVEPPSHQPTLRDWLLDQRKITAGDWTEESRYGVVHRLDTDTSGVMIWAKTLAAQEKLKLLWQGRQVQKTYLALVEGATEPSGTIELSIERDNKNDRQRVVLLPTAKARPAITTYKRLAAGESQKVSLVECHPITGRTHQLRVHLKAIGHPIIGDQLYGEKATDELAKELGLNRQFLHAWKISVDGQNYTAPLPIELQQLITRLGLDIPS